MKVKLHIMGPVKKTVDKNPVDVEMAEGTTILDLMKTIGYTESEAKFMVYVRGEDRIRIYDRLREDDEIKAVLQVGGG